MKKRIGLKNYSFLKANEKKPDDLKMLKIERLLWLSLTVNEPFLNHLVKREK